MKYLQIIFLFCLLIACDAPTKIKHPNFDLRLSYIDSLKVGDTLSQAYLEAFIALRRRDSLPNTPVNLDTARVWYAEEQDNYPSRQYPLSYIFSTDTVDIFWKSDSIRCTRVPALSSKNIQVYACKIGQRGIHIRTHKPNPNDKNNLIEFLLPEFLQKKDIILAKQANGYWKFVKERYVGKFGDARYWTDKSKQNPVSILAEPQQIPTSAGELWDEAAFKFRKIPAEFVQNWARKPDTTIHDNIFVASAARLIDVRKDTLHISYDFLTETDSLETIWVWNNTLRHYYYRCAIKAKGSKSQQLKEKLVLFTKMYLSYHTELHKRILKISPKFLSIFWYLKSIKYHNIYRPSSFILKKSLKT